MTRTIRTTAVRGVGAALVALAIVSAGLVGCSAPAEKQAQPAVSATKQAAYPVTFTDDASRTVTVKAEPQRIVSLAPANTETLFAIGAGDRVVGVTSYDDYPSQVATIAKVGDFAGPNVEAVAATKPDLILATSGVQADVVKKLEALGATVVVVDPQSLAAVYRDIQQVGVVTNEADRANALVAAMKSRVAGISAKVSSEPSATAFIEIAQNPLFTAGTGTLLDELITLGGGTNVVTLPGYTAYSSEQVIKADPQVYLATKGSMSDPSQLAKRPGYKQLSAVKTGRVVILDDNLVSRPGPRIVDGLAQIAHALHPNAFPGGQ